MSVPAEIGSALSLVIQAPDIPTPALKELARRTGATSIVSLPGRRDPGIPP